jgi:hypothetical protein
VPNNPPGLSAVARRVGTWAQFKESMLARLSSADYPALQALRTRQDDDFTIAMLDATSLVLDILTFYQERLANECYLRTAQQPRSLTELSRLIGYQPAPGVAASTYLAFTLKTTPGQPANPGAPAITIPKGTQVQSVPAQGQAPQTFETSADIQAKPDWTSLQVQTGLPWQPQLGDTFVYLQGTATQLQPGDLFLIVGDERLADATNLNWDVRMVAAVQADGANNRTLVTWTQGLGHLAFQGRQRVLLNPASVNPKFYAFRQRAALFGYNAIDPRLLNVTHIPNIGSLLQTGDLQWANFQLSDTIDLDSVYPKVTNGGWVALMESISSASLFNITSASSVSRSDFGLSAKITRITPDSTAILPAYPLRGTIAMVQSEQIEVAEQPLLAPLYGTMISLETLRNDMAGVQVIAISGNRQKITVLTPSSSPIHFIPDDGSYEYRPIGVGEVLTLVSAVNLPLNSDGSIQNWAAATTPQTLFVEDVYGRSGTVLAAPSSLALAPVASGDPVVSEYAMVLLVDSTMQVNSVLDVAHTWFKLNSTLTYCYDRSTTTVNANVALATAGQSVTEILGNGSASTPNQEFTLKQSPLTFVQAATPAGYASTLQVEANGMDWTLVPSLYQANPSAPVYAAMNQADGTTDVLFGDGVEGATLPTGQNNIQANYRIGSGSAGNVAPGTLTTLLDRPLGVSGVTNPEAATGGQDSQSLSDIRLNAPQTVLTLGRAVSITDYQNYAGTFAGVSKAYAVWIPSGPGHGVYLTVAGVGGSAVPPGNPTNGYLIASLQAYGNPLVPVTVQTYVETLFSIAASVQYNPLFDQTVVQAQILGALSTSFNFSVRSFGQGVSMDEVATVIQNVPGVVAVNVTSLTRGDSSQGGDISQIKAPTVSQWNQWYAVQPPAPLVPPSPDTPSRLCASLPVASQTSLPQPAEILVLDPRPTGVVLGVMS